MFNLWTSSSAHKDRFSALCADAATVDATTNISEERKRWNQAKARTAIEPRRDIPSSDADDHVHGEEQKHSVVHLLNKGYLSSSKSLFKVCLIHGGLEEDERKKTGFCGLN